MNFCARPNLDRRKSCLRELSCQIHGETSSLGGPHKFLRVRSFALLKTRRERECTFKGSAPEPHRAIAFLKSSIPYRGCISNGHIYLLLKIISDHILQ